MNVADVLLGIAVLVLAVGGLMILVAAFQESAGWGVLCFLFSPIFIIARWDKAKNGFLIQLASFPVFIAGAMAGPGDMGQSIIHFVPPYRLLYPAFRRAEKPREPVASTAASPASKAARDKHVVRFEPIQAPKPVPVEAAPAAPPPKVEAPPQPKAPPPPLVVAAKEGDNNKILELLVQPGMDVNAKDSDSRNALMHAAAGGHADAVETLLKQGADVNAADKDGWTALMLAAYQGRPSATQLLLDAGADSNAKTTRHTTALIVAAGQGHAAVVEMLIKAGADVNAKDADGKSALGYATQKNHGDVMELLKKAGAKDA